MKKVIYIVAVFCFIVNIAIGQKKEKVAPGLLDKKAYAIELVKEGKNKGAEKEDIKFGAGKFNWTTMVGDGYKPTIYEATFDSSARPFTCSFTVEAQGENLSFENILNLSECFISSTNVLI
jgi:hypothetical protein